MTRIAINGASARLAVVALAVFMAPAATMAAPQATSAINPVRLAGLGPYIDGVVAQQIATREVAGAVVTIVYRGRMLFSRGYGYADVATRRPVDPERTLFRPGSVSKLFTWTALMQQVEAGRVSLDADVNTYLDFRIPPFQGQPIRVRDLLSHSPGMSDVSDFIVGSPEKITPYQQWIKAHLPERRWPAGTEIAYSNYGAALAGYIVERVSGEAYLDYVERHIFRPLGMASTTFREPLPAALTQRMATGYKVIDGRLAPKPFEWLSSIMPAGSATSTAPDMARFMLAILNGGALDGARILRPESVRYLESDSFANAPGLPGMAHGFLVERTVGPRLVGHAGNTVDFHSDLVIAPAEGFGFFVSFTGGPGSNSARTLLRDAILGRVFPQAPAPRWAGSEPPPPLGRYRSNRLDYSKPADPADDLMLDNPAPHFVTVKTGPSVTAWEQVGPGRFEEVTGARDGGPFDQLQFYGTAADPRLQISSHPYETYHLVKAN